MVPVPKVSASLPQNLNVLVSRASLTAILDSGDVQNLAFFSPGSDGDATHEGMSCKSPFYLSN